MKPPKSPKVTCSASRENGQSLRPALYQTRPYASVKRVDNTTELIGLQLWLQRGAAYDIFYSQTLDPTRHGTVLHRMHLSAGLAVTICC